MKNLIRASVIGLVSIVASFGMVVSVTHADTVCGDPSQSNGNTTYVACGNGPINYVMPWGDERTLPRVAAGQFVTDESGFKIWAPDFSWGAGWIDISHTDYYRGKMCVAKGQAVANGTVGQFPFLKDRVCK